MMYEQDANQKAHPLTMAGNRHYAKARVTEGPRGRVTSDARQVEATLALAFEQRTANLIALAAQDNRGYVAKRGLWQTIEARLGL